jgi:hypothetical protein
MLNLIPSDVGRNTFMPKELEVQDRSGNALRQRASGRQFQLGDGRHWTVVTLIPANGQLEKHQPES